MSDTFKVRFHHPDRVLSPNACAPLRGEAAVKLRYKQIAAKQEAKRKAVHLVRYALSAMADKGKFVPSGYKLVWFYKGVRPDADNCLARCKALLDGCAAAFGVNDRDLDCNGVERVHSLERGVAGTVVVEFEGMYDVRSTMYDVGSEAGCAREKGGRA